MAWEQAAPSTHRFIIHSRGDDHQILLATSRKASLHSLVRFRTYGSPQMMDLYVLARIDFFCA